MRKGKIVGKTVSLYWDVHYSIEKEVQHQSDVHLVFEDQEEGFVDNNSQIYSNTTDNHSKLSGSSSSNNGSKVSQNCYILPPNQSRIFDENSSEIFIEEQQKPKKQSPSEFKQ